MQSCFRCPIAEKRSRTSEPTTSSSDVNAELDEVDSSFISDVLDHYPSKEESEDEADLERKIREANERWKENYSGVVDDIDGKSVDVRFSDPTEWTVIEEDPEEADDLREARKNGILRWKADKERVMRAISPVLTPEHRSKVFERIYGEKSAPA